MFILNFAALYVSLKAQCLLVSGVFSSSRQYVSGCMYLDSIYAAERAVVADSVQCVWWRILSQPTVRSVAEALVLPLDDSACGGLTFYHFQIQVFDWQILHP